MVCSMIGGISVSVTTGLGSAIVTTAMGDNQVSVPVVRRQRGCPSSNFVPQFKHWFIYFLMVFIAVTLSMSLESGNMALSLIVYF